MCCHSLPLHSEAPVCKGDAADVEILLEAVGIGKKKSPRGERFSLFQGGFRHRDGSFGGREIKASTPLLLVRMQINPPSFHSSGVWE